MAVKGAPHGAVEIEQVFRLFPPECRDAQQQSDDVPPPELQQQQFCIEADALSFCIVFRSGAR
ncbi:MAG: hypothetical protein WBZ48_08255 [Bacteroidota bacterium]